MGRDTLEKGEGVADAIRGVGREGCGREERVDVGDFLKKGGHDAYRICALTC
jgi:hypothetical protein